jgi:hypothetical protein
MSISISLFVQRAIRGLAGGTAAGFYYEGRDPAHTIDVACVREAPARGRTQVTLERKAVVHEKAFQDWLRRRPAGGACGQTVLERLWLDIAPFRARMGDKTYWAVPA